MSHTCETIPDTKSGGFRETSFEKLYQLEQASFWFCARNDLLIWALRKYYPQLTSFMEIGCGTGFVIHAVSKAYPEASLVGGDLFDKALQFAATRTPRAEFVQFDATNIPWAGRFEVIGAFDVLEHICDDERVLSEIYKALRPNGGLILTVPQHPKLWSAADDYAKHVRRYTRRELLGKLENAGFTVLHCTSFVSLLLPFMAAFRWLQKAKRYEPTDEYSSASRFDGFLRATMGLERWLIQADFDFTFGGSLLVVCSKV